jgi:hypothetical protein
MQLITPFVTVRRQTAIHHFGGLAAGGLFIREFTMYDASAQLRGLNFSSRISAKQFDYCDKYLTLFQIALQTAKFG